MVTSQRFKLIAVILFAVALAIGAGVYLATKSSESRDGPPNNQVTATSPQEPRGGTPAGPFLSNESLRVASQPIEAALNEAHWPSMAQGRPNNATPAETFINSMSALVRGDLRFFALSMNQSAQSDFLEGRSIDDPYFQTLPQKVAAAGFQALTVESFKAERTTNGCRLVAMLSSVRGNQKISEEVTMALTDSSSGWMIEKYESRTAKREPAIQDKR